MPRTAPKPAAPAPPPVPAPHEAGLVGPDVQMQIEAARRFPRKTAECLAEIVELATVDVDTAASCTYAVPRRQRQPDGSWKTVIIRGPSVRFAEIVAYCWRNMRIEGRTVRDNGDTVTVRGTCWDVERNNIIAIEMDRNVLTRSGKRYPPDGVINAANAGSSIAVRNATFRVVPRALYLGAHTEAMRHAAGTPKTLPARRARALEALQKHHGVQAAQVLQLLNVDHVDKIDEDHLAILNGIHVALRDGETTVEEAFPDLAAAGEVQQPRQKGAAQQPADDQAPPAARASGPPEVATEAATATEPAGDATVLISRDQRKAILKAAKRQDRDLDDVTGYIQAHYQVGLLERLPAYLASAVEQAMGDPATEIP